jgi:hypothetical protein
MVSGKLSFKLGISGRICSLTTANRFLYLVDITLLLKKLYSQNKNYLAKIKIIWLTEGLFLKNKAFF